MANLWLDLKGPILADTVYVDGVLAAKDVTIALPPVNLVTADFKAMGTYTAPLPGQIEAMEASITKIGIDLGLRSLVKLTSKTIEIRWAQDVKLSDGSTKTEGCKAFLRCVSKGIPGLNVDPGNASENEIALAVSRYHGTKLLRRRQGHGLGAQFGQTVHHVRRMRSFFEGVVNSRYQFRLQIARCVKAEPGDR